MTPTNIRELLLRDEGCVLKAYKDQVGKTTIGVGRNLDDKGISLAEAELMLDNDISEYTAAVIAELPWVARLDEPRRAVLVSMGFNLGVAGLLKFKKFLAAAEKGNWTQAKIEGLDSKWARQVEHRSDRLMEQLVTGEWR